MSKIAVYLCECGNNIADNLALDKLQQYFTAADQVDVFTHELLCGEEGKVWLKDNLVDGNYDRFVIAACSPKQHEHTFKKVCEEAELNPYLFQLVNIREQCAWMHRDAEKATLKATRMIQGAIERTNNQVAFVVKKIDACTNVLVVGGGIAGIEAALLMADSGRQVYLLEKNSYIGGKVTTYEEVYPNMECATCMLEEKLDKVLHHDNIQILVNSELQKVVGSYGNFIVNVVKKADYVIREACIGCSACYEPCPVSVPNKIDFGMSERKAIYVPFIGSLPNIPIIDKENCLRFKGEECNKCEEICPFAAFDFEQKDILHELNVGAIVVATGFDSFDLDKIPALGSKYQDVYSGLQFERILSSSGPTNGEIKKQDGSEPQEVTIIHCAGSRDDEHLDYCSGTCCLTALKYAKLIDKKLPQTKVNHLVLDWCLPGVGAQKFKASLANNSNIQFIRLDNLKSINVRSANGGDNGNYQIAFQSRGQEKTLTSDLVILNGGMASSKGSKQIFDLLKMEPDQRGFVETEHNKLDPVSSLLKGIMVVGAAAGPIGIEGAVAQAEASAGKVLSSIVPGQKLTMEVTTSEIDEDLCSGCKTCIITCPYDAITFDQEKEVSLVTEVLCHGCGTCTPACPSGAITNRHFTDTQIMAEISGSLQE